MNVRVDVRACVSGPTGVGGPPSDGNECANPITPHPTHQQNARLHGVGRCVCVVGCVDSCGVVSSGLCHMVRLGGERKSLQSIVCNKKH